MTPFEESCEKYYYNDVRDFAPERCQDLAEEFETISVLAVDVRDHVD